jgi:hypothetical protein
MSPTEEAEALPTLLLNPTYTSIFKRRLLAGELPAEVEIKLWVLRYGESE